MDSVGWKIPHIDAERALLFHRQVTRVTCTDEKPFPFVADPNLHTKILYLISLIKGLIFISSTHLY